MRFVCSNVLLIEPLPYLNVTDFKTIIIVSVQTFIQHRICSCLLASLYTQLIWTTQSWASNNLILFYGLHPITFPITYTVSKDSFTTWYVSILLRNSVHVKAKPVMIRKCPIILNIMHDHFRWMIRSLECVIMNGFVTSKLQLITSCPNRFQDIDLLLTNSSHWE